MPDTVLDADAELWNAPRAWPAAIDHLSKRFGRVRPLPDDVVARRDGDQVDVAADMHALQAWAPDDVDLERELQKFFDENMPRFVRPRAQLKRDLIARGGGSPLPVTSALPRAALEAALRHAGLLRYVELP